MWMVASAWLGGQAQLPQQVRGKTNHSYDTRVCLPQVTLQFVCGAQTCNHTVCLTQA
jgi:hypothetical protein